MLVSWNWDKPVTCTEHGQLSDGPLPHHDAGILALTHLRDVHGVPADEAIAKVQAHKDATAAPVIIR